MKNYLSFLLVCLLSWSCGKEDPVRSDCAEPLGNQFLVYQYFNSGTPTISESPIDESSDVSYDSASAVVRGNEVVITVPGIRIKSDQNNYEVLTFQVDERTAGDECFVNQAEFGTGSTSVKTNITSVLVLDMSSSLADIIADLKSHAKEYANTIVNSSGNSEVAVVFFSSRDAIEVTPFFNASNIAQLNDLIDSFTNYRDRTALYQATKVGLDLLADREFDGEKSLVVFTDGGDNDSNNPTALVQEIRSSDINRFAIGLKGADFRENNLASIVSSEGNMVVAEDSSDLQAVFRQVGRGVISVYELEYRRSDQLLDANEAIEIRISFETKPIQ